MAIKRDQQQSDHSERTPAKPATQASTPNLAENLTAPAAGLALNLPVGVLGQADILTLQRTMGNRAVQRLLARRHVPRTERRSESATGSHTNDPAGVAGVVQSSSNIIARNPSKNAKGGKGGKGGKGSGATTATPTVNSKPAANTRGKAASEEAKAASLLAAAAATAASDRDATAEVAALNLKEAETQKTKVDNQAKIFDDAFKIDDSLSGWKAGVIQAKARATSAVATATTASKARTTAEAAFTLASDAATLAATKQIRAKGGTNAVQNLLAALRSKEQEVYSAATTAGASEAAKATATQAKVIANGRTKCAELIAEIETAASTAKTAVSTVGDVMAGMPILTRTMDKSSAASASLEQAQESLAVVDLIAQHAAQTVVRAQRVAKAKVDADQKAEAAEKAQQESVKQADAIKAAEKAAKEFADIAQKAQDEAQRVGDIKRAADALAKSETEAHTNALAAAKTLEAQLDAADQAEPYMVEGYREDAQTKINAAAGRKTQAESDAEAATAPKEQADLLAADTRKVADEAHLKATDPVTLQKAADAADTATSTKQASTTAATGRDAALVTAQAGVTADTEAFAQQERLRTLAGGQVRVNQLSIAIPALGKLETLLNQMGYDRLKKLLDLAGGLTQLEGLMGQVTDDNVLDTFLTKLGYDTLDKYLTLPLTPVQISDLLTRVPDAEQLIRLMTHLEYVRLDRMLKLPDSTAHIVDKLSKKIPDNTKLDSWVTELGIKILDKYVTDGVTVKQLEDFLTKLPDATKRTAVLTACDGKVSLVNDLLTKTNDDADGRLGLWLSAAGGHKAAALNTYLDDADLKADQSKIWSSTQTIAATAVPITKPAGVASMTLAEIITSAVPKQGSSGPAINDYAGNRVWGTPPRKPGDAVLPQYNASGGSITYKEYDIHPYTGANRGADRVVVGSDGRKYFTGDHYEHYQLIQ